MIATPTSAGEAAPPGSKDGPGPVRMCVGCRARRPVNELIRLGVEDGRLAVVSRPDRGRSVYLCPRAACLEQAARRRAFSRGLRLPGEVDERLPDELRKAVLAGEVVR